MQEALALVRRELGGKASVLRTREVRASGVFGWLSGARQIEVMASATVTVPSRLPPRVRPAAVQAPAKALPEAAGVARQQQSHEVTPLRAPQRRPEPNECLFKLFAELLDAEVSEDLASELLERVRSQASAEQVVETAHLKDMLAESIEHEIPIAGPIRAGVDRRRLVALVGPTGVGKTTTIAKLAANFQLREKCRVGLITVDTYRIAAVEQLRTYADIIDLPMEIVATPREMHQALARMAGLDLILMDTAGRSPRDEVKLQELKSMLAEAAPDEVHLVLSSVASASTLVKTAAQFAAVGTTSLILTKLDEAVSLGNLLPLVRSSRLPLSYLTHGQNVPDDITIAQAGRLARTILGMELMGSHQPLARS